MVTIAAPRKSVALGRGKHTDRAGYTLASYEKIEKWCRKASDIAGIDVSDTSWYREAIERIYAIVDASPRSQAQVDELADLEDTMRFGFAEAGFDPEPSHLVPHYAHLVSIQYQRQLQREGIS